MEAFCITLSGHPYSETVAARCIRTADEVGGITVKRFEAVNKERAEVVMAARKLRWTWTTDEIRYCPVTGLRQHAYGGDVRARLGCAMSHLLLWERCVDLGEPILVLEHDAVFVRAMPAIDFHGICQINDPAGATPRGRWWHDRMVERGTTGVHHKTLVREDRSIPDGLAGNSAYLLEPFAALELIGLYRMIGVWPNDATMCGQLLPYLSEFYPFITRVDQWQSTTQS